MAKFKDVGFQDRAAAAAKARSDALAKLKAKPPVDPEVVAARIAAARAKEEAAAEKRRLKQEAEAAEREAKRLKAEQAEAEAREAVENQTDNATERKAARDARYAARKLRVLKK